MAIIQGLSNDIINKLNDKAREVYYNNDFVSFNRVYNLLIVETNWQTLTEIFINIFWTKTFEEAIGHTIKKPLG